AAAVMELYPNVKLGIGPPIDTGFFYEFLHDEPFTPEDLAKIEKKMHELAAQDLPNERKLMPKPEALALYKKTNQIFKCELVEHLHRLEEAKRRDHRKLGTELDLFSIQEEAGPGLIFWHPKGGLIRKIVEDWLRDELLKRGYDLVYTPHIMRLDLWKTSGHTGFYKDSMFGPVEVEKADYQLKPMNCTGPILIYK